MLFPHADAKAWFLGNQPKIDATAFRNWTLQGAYLMLAARAIGLDVGPMSGFDNAGRRQGVLRRHDVIVRISCATSAMAIPRACSAAPRFAFDEMAQIV